MKRITSFIIVILTTVFCYAVQAQPEKFYQNQWCSENRGKSEVVLPDQTRCDCLTDTNAIEFDFGKKWAEAIGQSLYYSAQTGKKAGIVLILKNEKEYKYWIRLNSTITHFNLPIDTWYMMDQSH